LRIGAVVGEKLTPPSSDRQTVPLALAARNSLDPSPLAPAPLQLSRGRSTVATWTGAPLETPPLPRLATVTTAVSGPVLLAGVGVGDEAGSETVSCVAVAATTTAPGERPLPRTTTLACGLAASKPDPEIVSVAASKASAAALRETATGSTGGVGVGGVGVGVGGFGSGGGCCTERPSVPRSRALASASRSARPCTRPCARPVAACAACAAALAAERSSALRVCLFFFFGGGGPGFRFSFFAPEVFRRWANGAQCLSLNLAFPLCSRSQLLPQNGSIRSCP